MRQTLVSACAFRPVAFGALAASVLFTCAGATFDGAVLHKGDTSYRVGPLPREWARIQIDEGDLAFRHQDGGTIMANATCHDIEDVPLDVLTNHLLFGVEERKNETREKLTLDGRAALRTRLVGTLDGVPLCFDLVVLKKDGCAYDLQLVSGPHHYAERVVVFERFFTAFAASPRSPSS